MRLAALVVAALAALVATPTGAAKGLTGPIQVCGADRCVQIRERPVLSAVERIMLNSPLEVAAPPLAPYVVVRTAAPYESVIAYVVDGTNAVAWVFGSQRRWVLADESLLNRLRFAPVRRYDAPLPWRAFVGGRPATHPARFSALLGALPRAPLPDADAGWTLIELTWEQPNPWTDWSGQLQLRYARDDGVLAREGGWLRVPEDTATDLGLRPLSHDRSIWPVLAIVLVALTAAAVWYLRLRGGRAHAGRDPRAAGVAARGADRPSAP